MVDWTDPYQQEMKKEVIVPRMLGSTTGYSYMAFARKGKVALALKPNAVLDGELQGVKNTTYIGAKVRSAPFNTVHFPPGFDSDIGDGTAGNVISLASAAQTDLAGAWPLLEFEKQDENRCSTQIGVYLRGSFAGNPELLQSNIENNKLSQKMVDYMIMMADGEDNLLVSPRLLRDWLNSIYDPQFDKMFKAVKNHKIAQDVISEEVEANLGNFGMQASILKKIKAAQAASDTPSSAIPDVDEDDQDDDVHIEDDDDENGDNED